MALVWMGCWDSKCADNIITGMVGVGVDVGVVTGDEVWVGTCGTDGEGRGGKMRFVPVIKCQVDGLVHWH